MSHPLDGVRCNITCPNPDSTHSTAWLLPKRPKPGAHGAKRARFVPKEALHAWRECIYREVWLVVTQPVDDAVCGKYVHCAPTP